MTTSSSPCFNMKNNERYWNENTPPDRIIKALPLLPSPKWKRVVYSPSVTIDSTENLIKKLEKINMNESADEMSKQSYNLGHIDYCHSNVNKEINESSSGKTESFNTDKSISSNGYASNSGINDSSIFNSSNDDHPDTSTPHHQSIIYSNSKYKIFKPPNLVIKEASDKQNYQKMLDSAQYSPVRSPFSPNTSNDSLFGNEETPESLLYDTPPKGIYLKDSEMKMVHLLKRFRLSHFAFLFIEQEVDLELFLTLNDQDLKEIGIKRNTDRNVLLSVISECNTRLIG